MKKALLAGAAFLAAIAAVSGVSYGVGTFTADAKKFAGVPTGHIPGKDNGTDSGASGGNRFHMPGEDCGICHKPGGKAGSYVFTMSGTIYKDRTGRDPLEGAEIILEDYTGAVISMTSNSAGNFFTYATIASDPGGWNGAKTAAENQADPGTWRYKAWVKYGDYVTPMVTIAPVGGMSAPRMGCSMHHSPLGSRGALAPAGISIHKSFPASGVSFKRHVMPILKNKCKACHMPASANPATTYPTGVTYNYSGGLDLSAYAKDAGSAKGITDVVSTSSPEGSVFFTKTLMGATHAGGPFWRTTDSEYSLIRQWIAEGAQNN